MIRALVARLRQKHRTIAYPAVVPELPDRWRCRPVIAPDLCVDGCRACADVCPTGAILAGSTPPLIDLGRCLFCPECAAACPTGAITYSRDHRMATRGRDDLIVGDELHLARALDDAALRVFGRSLKLRQVSAGGCNGCEADVNVLSTVVFDLARFGVQFVASPRHADGLLITGPVTRNMEAALRKTWEAVPTPRLVIAVGACAISGGPYLDHPETLNGAAAVVPVDLHVPGCPPHPLTILDGILRLLDKLPPT
ncbi:MAG: NADH-quinone oxidoreductase subunit NuoB [bacterium]|nr:NADH-quinone oxidoreductase subunit NuoB [bacterium]